MSCDFFVSSEAYNLGTFNSGISADGMFPVVCWAAIRELPKWKNQQYELKKAEVAGKSLACGLRIIQALEFLCSPMVDAPEIATGEMGPLKKSYRPRQDFIKNRLKGDRTGFEESLFSYE